MKFSTKPTPELRDADAPERVWMHCSLGYWFSVADECKEPGDVEYIRVDKALTAFPTSWLDDLLTGPTAVIGKPPWGCSDVERLLAAIKARVTSDTKDGHTQEQAGVLIEEEER